MFAAELDVAMACAEDRAASEGAFELLRATAAETVEPGEDEMMAAIALCSLVHGLSMLILDGRIPPEHVASEAQVEALTRAAFAHWRR